MQAGAPSGTVGFLVHYGTLATPANLTVQGATDTFVQLSWSAVEGATAYKITYAATLLDNSTIGTGEWAAGAGIADTKLIITGLKAMSSYIFRVYPGSESGAYMDHAANVSYITHAPIGHACECVPGSGPCCQVDCLLAPSTQECRASSGDCDQAEHCSGIDWQCPPG